MAPCTAHGALIFIHGCGLVSQLPRWSGFTNQSHPSFTDEETEAGV